MSTASEYLPDDSERRQPPHSIEAEQGVLGCIFLQPAECLATCIERLRGGALCFYDLRHQTIYSCLAQMCERREAIDVITVQQRLKDAGTLELMPRLLPASTHGKDYNAFLTTRTIPEGF